MIKVSIERIQQAEAPQFHFHGTQSELGLENLEFPIHDIDIVFRLLEAEGGFYLTGQLTGTAELQCHRCLTDFEYALDLELKALIVYEKHRDLEDEAGVIEIDAYSQEIDLTKFIRDSILLDIPYKILCSEDCNGLCPQCGTNLNEDSCDCSFDTIDPRWEKLKELKSDGEGE